MAFTLDDADRARYARLEKIQKINLEYLENNNAPEYFYPVLIREGFPDAGSLMFTNGGFERFNNTINTIRSNPGLQAKMVELAIDPENSYTDVLVIGDSVVEGFLSNLNPRIIDNFSDAYKERLSSVGIEVLENVNTRLNIDEIGFKDAIFMGDGNSYLTLTDNVVRTNNGLFSHTSSPTDVYAGAGNDTINAWALDINTSLHGGAGNDRIFGGNASDFITGGTGNDRIYGFNGNDRVQGGEGNDRIYGHNGDDNLQGDGGVDVILGGNGNDTIKGGTGRDYLYGNSGNDTIHGDEGSDIIRGGTGNDVILGGSGNDYLYGQDGRDSIRGGTGNDVILGGSGNDRLYGDDGNDRMWGEDGNDILYGGRGNDTLDGGEGRDFLFGMSGNDVVRGGNGNDILLGGSGNDTLRGQNDNDVLYGQSGHDTLLGGNGNDTLYGHSGHDRLYGGSGDDRIFGGSGNDYMSGGAGNDTFVVTATGGFDHIVDYSRTNDTIKLNELLDMDQGELITDFISIERSGNGHKISIDLDGDGNAHQMQDVAYVSSNYVLLEVQTTSGESFEYGAAFSDGFVIA